MSEWLQEILGDKVVSGDWKRGSIVKLAPDLIVAHDISFPFAAKAFTSMGGKVVAHPGRVYLIHDHLQPAKDASSAELGRKGLEFASKMGISNVFTAGRAGILTVALDEITKLEPGMLIAGTDTHMLTYGAFGIISLNIGPTDFAECMLNGTFWFEVPETLEFCLNGRPDKYAGGRDVGLWLLKEIGMDGGLGKFFHLTGDYPSGIRICSRRHLCSLMAEAGAIGAYMQPDATIVSCLGLPDETPVQPGKTLECDVSRTFDISGLGPLVATPGRVDSAVPVEEVGDVSVGSVFIGSCAGGSLEDLQALDMVLRSNKIHKSLRLMVVPQTVGTYNAAERLGIIDRIASKGAYIAGPGCGPCMGAHLGVLARDEICVSTSPRNFQGRMGSKLARIYLSNAWVAATAAVTGKIVHPSKVMA